MEIQHDVSLKKYTTFKTGGFARLFCVVRTKGELVDAVSYAQKKNVPFYILGGGSNVLASENGFDGLVIHIAIEGVVFINHDADLVLMKIEAGVLWDECVRIAVENNMYGLENLSLIPGTVGASPVQNIGAYGVEVADVIESVEVLNTETSLFETLSKEQCLFGYRDSIFKKEMGKKYIVVGVHFLLSKKVLLKTDYKDIQEYFSLKGGEITPESLRGAIIEIRTGKLPNLERIGTAGSFFKNPVVKREIVETLQKEYPLIPIYEIEIDGYIKTSAAFLIDKIAGMKGSRMGDVGTYENQALVLVNYGSATAEEVLTFSKNIQKEVFEKTGIQLEREVQTLGF